MQEIPAKLTGIITPEKLKGPYALRISESSFLDYLRAMADCYYGNGNGEVSPAEASLFIEKANVEVKSTNREKTLRQPDIAKYFTMEANHFQSEPLYLAGVFSKLHIAQTPASREAVIRQYRNFSQQLLRK